MIEFCADPRKNAELNRQVEILIDEVIKDRDMTIRYSDCQMVMRRVVRETVESIMQNYNVEP